MPPPEKPFRWLATWTTLVADAAAMAALWLSSLSLVLQVGATALQLIGMVWISAQYLGRRREYARLMPRIRSLEREVDCMRSTGPARPDAWHPGDELPGLGDASAPDAVKAVRVERDDPVASGSGLDR